ncbi:DUF2948 family protein [Pararhizobium sp.]|uniref:DUF2948 family protein n=1 Tax=Pararhizobium sp. TaxID=1977563 RepID=UPI00271F2141|nr:DUF2948 family protein [Pararhizobium sp.]MDO9416228.1 DUF2948 family protein [Pararhizobium sp.]
MDSLKLMALDAEDLDIVSAHVQDAVVKVADLAARPGQFSLVVNRFVWESAEARGKSFERRRAILLFKRVEAVRSIGIDRSKAEDVLSLLAIRYVPKGEGPEGTVEVLMAGDASLAFDVECIEVQLADTGGAWETMSKPRHPDGD